MKKLLIISVLIFSFFCLNSFCQELIIVDADENSYEETLQFYNDYSSLLKSYILTNDENSLKKYVEMSEEIYTIDNVFTDIFSCVISESLFYWNYFRNYFDEESKNIIDKEIIYFWNYIKDNRILDNEFFTAVNYVKSFSSLKHTDFEFMLPIQDFVINENKTEVNIPSAVFIRNDFYQTLAKAEFLLHQLNSDAFKTNSVLAESTFYEIANNPKLLYVIFSNEKYSLIQDFFINAVKELFDYDFIFETDNVDFKNFYTFVPETFYKQVFSLFPDYQKNEVANYQYEFCNSFTSFILKYYKEGFDISKIFSTSEINIINLILENPYAAFCVETEMLNELLIKFKIILNFDYFMPFVISNLKCESVENE